MDRKTLILQLALVTIILCTVGPLFHPKIPMARAQATLTIDMTYADSERVNVRGIAYMGVRIIYTDTKAPLQWAKVYFENQPGQWYTNWQGWCVIPVVSWDIGRFNLTVDRVYIGDFPLDFEQGVPEASTIFDEVLIDLKTLESRVGVGTEAPIYWDAVYASDGAPFNGDLFFNYDNFTSNEMGPRVFTVEEIVNDEYAVNVFQANPLEIIYDRVNLTLSVEENRIGTDEQAEIDWIGYYEYDGEPFDGWVEFNYSLSQEEPGVYSFEAESVYDTKFGVETAISNAVDIIFDEVVVNLSANRERLEVGDDTRISWDAYYWYNSEPFDGSITLNRESFTSHKVGSKNYFVERVEDPLHGLTAFSSNEIVVTWDKLVVELMASDERIDLGEEAEILWRATYESDGADVSENVTVEVTPRLFVRESVGEILYQVVNIKDHLYGVRSYTSTPVNIVWDRIKIELKAPEGRVEVGRQAPLAIQAVYEYDGKPLQGEVEINGTLVSGEAGSRGYAVSSVTETQYGLSGYTSNEISVLWDEVIVKKNVNSFIPGRTTVVFEIYYASDEEPVTSVDVLVGDKRCREVKPGRYVYSEGGFNPIITLDAEVSGPGIFQEYQYGSQINFGLIGFSVAFVGAVVAMLVYRGSLGLSFGR